MTKTISTTRTLDAAPKIREDLTFGDYKEIAKGCTTPQLQFLLKKYAADILISGVISREIEQRGC